MEEVLSVKRKEEERRHWLEELDKQREETTERRRREKLLQSQVQLRWRGNQSHYNRSDAAETGDFIHIPKILHISISYIYIYV